MSAHAMAATAGPARLVRPVSTDLLARKAFLAATALTVSLAATARTAPMASTAATAPPV